MRALRIVALAAVIGAAAVLAFPAFLAVRAMGSKVFEPQPFDFALLFAAVVGIAIGVQVAPWRTSRYVLLLAVLASGFLLFGVLAALSIGLAFLPAGVVLLLLLYRALRRAPRGAASVRAALGGTAIGFALPLLYIALIVPPTVECFPNGAGTSSGRWRSGSRQLQSSMGGGSALEPGVFTGRSVYSDSIVTFRCEGGKVVEFQRQPR